MSNKKILVFTLFGCPYCVSLKDKLNESDIQFTEIDVELNPNIWNQVVEQTNENVLPMVYIYEEGQSDGNIYIPGKNYVDEDDMLIIIKEHFS